MAENSSDSFQERLNTLWNQGSKDIAIAFLRRVMASEMTLLELRAALAFPHVRPHLDNLLLGDILARAPVAPERASERTAAAAGSSQARAAAAPARASATRRKRRSPEEMEATRQALMGRLQAAVGPVTTSHLRDVLNNGGHSVDLLQLGRMLAALEQDGYITCLGGKPKAWRLKPQGRRAPEPLVIRKASRSEQKEDAAAV
jgi:hypothetical protein